MKPGPQPQTPEDRFWPKVEKSDSCWIFTGCTNAYGHGVFYLGREGSKKKKIRAHVFAYTTLVGTVPDGLELDHLCRNPSCVRPDHLEPVTHRENVLRGNSPAARHAAATHCPHGHEFTPENTYYSPKKGRRCRTCGRAREAERRANRTPEERERSSEYFRNHKRTPEQIAARNARGRQRRAEEKARRSGDLIGAFFAREDVA